jgi:hypothetical protein
MIFLLWLALQDLSSGDIDEREKAAQALLQGGAASVPKLLSLMDSTDAELHGRAEDILLKIGLTAVPPLEAARTEKASKLARRVVRAKAESLLLAPSSIIEWADPPAWEGMPGLEIGDGSGHGFTLRWVRFKPGKDGVEVLQLKLVLGRVPYETKWPPDRAPLEVRRGTMDPAEYAGLLRVVATLGAATLKERPSGRSVGSSADFWVSARVASAEKELLEASWAGYRSSGMEHAYAQPRAIVEFADERVQAAVKLEEATLTAGERAWISGKVVRDWSRIDREKSFWWWVRERYLILAGVAGDASLLPFLKERIGGDPRSRETYHAVNSATRLLGKDVRGTPVEEMDIEVVRPKLLQLLER